MDSWMLKTKILDLFKFQGREMDTRCTIYKKTEEVYQLKLKASRMFYSEVSFNVKSQYNFYYLRWLIYARAAKEITLYFVIMETV